MAQRGRKPDSVADKVARGTMKPTADALAQMARVPGDTPVRSEFLNEDYDEVWEREIGHFVQGGATRRDSAFVSMIVYRLAVFEEMARKSRMLDDAGNPLCDPPPITLTEQLRIALEAFGMAGPKSRATAGSGRAATRNNPFARNGSRTSP